MTNDINNGTHWQPISEEDKPGVLQELATMIAGLNTSAVTWIQRTRRRLVDARARMAAALAAERAQYESVFAANLVLRRLTWLPRELVPRIMPSGLGRLGRPATY